MASPGATREAVSSAAQELPAFRGRWRGLENLLCAQHVFVHQVLKICCVWGQKGALQSSNLTTCPEQARSLPCLHCCL